MNIRNRLPLLCVPIYFLSFFSINPQNWLSVDAVFFSKVKTSEITFMFNRYMQWSSRLWIEGAIVFSCRNVSLFILISLICTATVSICISCILNFSRLMDNIILSVLIICLFPLFSMNSAGWIATTVSYLWPLTLFLIWLSIDVFRKSHRINKSLVAVGLITLLLSVCSEVVAVLAVSYLLISFLVDRHQIKNVYFIGSSVLAIVGVINVLVCPGNSVRKQAEIVHFSQFKDLSFFDKIFIQVNHLGISLFSTNSLLFVSFCIILLVASAILKTLVPACLITISLILQGISSNYIHTRFDNIAHQLAAGELTDNSIRSLFYPNLFFVTAVVLIGVAIALMYKKSLKTLYLLFSFSVTVVLSLAVSLSPSILASADRPFIPLYIVFIVSGSFIVNKTIIPASQDIVLRNK